MAYGNQAKQPPQRTTASGVQVTTMDIQGKAYVPVAARIAEVNASTMVPRFTMKSSRFFEYANIHLCEVVIEIDGEILADGTMGPTKQFIGTCTANFGATKGIDAKAAAENAQTSALGRALGLAGFGSLESVASAEEVINAINRDPAGQKPSGNTVGNGNASGQGAKPAQQTTQPKDDLAALRKRFGELKEKLLAFKEDEDNINAVVAAHKADPAKMVEMLEKAYLLRCANDAYLEDVVGTGKASAETIDACMGEFKRVCGTDNYQLTLASDNAALTKPTVAQLKELLAFIQKFSV